ncbi:uncharacterized protein LOC126474502 [Schistocerca serialis cubense]|uniref:uncharacterized protein LOC126474502 n=1 Tax=Schistocerca serialis cubense TaxID=2023355 RepID=UPI00214E42AE|nr:uncharacterized protein LOC126474502 [Schistocerca serialis cubense]
MSVKEALCIVPKVFEGNKKDVREFIENVYAAFELVKPEEHETLLKFVKAKITGEARSRLQVRERTGTWQEVKRVLEENYASKRTIDYYACKIFQARQGQGEPIAMWASRIDEMQRDFREAVNRVMARENLRGAIEQVDSLGRACFIQGLSNDRIQTIVRSRGDEITLAAAVELALQEESAILSMKERGLAPRVTYTRNKEAVKNVREKPTPEAKFSTESLNVSFRPPVTMETTATSARSPPSDPRRSGPWTESAAPEDGPAAPADASAREVCEALSFC